MRLLMAEGAFALFDFTEGEGQHKSLFASGSVDCVDVEKRNEERNAEEKVASSGQ